MDDRLRLGGVELALVAAVLFGISGVVSADAFGTVEPIQLAEIRSAIAAVLLSIAARRRFDPTAIRRHLRSLIGFGALLATVTITFYETIDRLGVGPGVTLQFLGPIGVLGWMRLVERRAVSAGAWLAALAAIIGTLLMNRPWDLVGVDPIGVMAGLAAAVSFAGYLIVGSRVGRAVPALVATAAGFVVSSAIYLILAPPSVPAFPPVVWGQILWVAVVGTALAFVIEMMALERGDPGRVGVAATLEPVVAAAGAWIVLDQHLEPVQVLGAALVVVGVALVQYATADMPDLAA